MPRTWFDHLVVSSPHEERRSGIGVALSVGTHAVFAAALVVIPALGRAQLPETEDRRPIPVVELAPAVTPPTPPPVRPRPPAHPRDSSRRQAEQREVAPAPTAGLPVGEVRELEPGDPPAVCLVDCGTGDQNGTGPVGATIGMPDGGGTGNEPLRPGGDIREPKRVHYVEPGYPELARRARVEDMVILECVLDEKGRVQDVRVLRGHPLLSPSAVTAVKEWRYTPTLLNGVPVRVVMTVTVRFHLGGK